VVAVAAVTGVGMGAQLGKVVGREGVGVMVAVVVVAMAGVRVMGVVRVIGVAEMAGLAVQMGLGNMGWRRYGRRGWNG
jgi:hypothetical protein